MHKSKGFNQSRNGISFHPLGEEATPAIKASKPSAFMRLLRFLAAMKLRLLG
jgi:hypothetical protein